MKTGKKKKDEDVFSSEENTAAFEGEDVATYQDADYDEEIFKWYENEDGTATITEYKGTKIVVTIPSKLGGCTVTRLEWAFNTCTECSAMEVIVPDSVQTIEHSFEACPNITKVVLGSGVTSIDEETFDGSPNLKTMIVSDKNTVYSAEGSILYNKAKTEIKDVLEGISGNVKISDKVEEIKNGQFWGRSELKGVTLPNGLKRIGYNAFRNCTGLMGIVIPDSVQEIAPGAFKECSGLRSVSLGRDVRHLYGSFTDSISLTNIVIPPEVTEMDQYAAGYYYDSFLNKEVKIKQ